MKWVIEGFSQEYAMTLKKVVPTKGSKDKLIKIDCTDLVILRWFVDFYPNMRKMTVDGKEYAWLAHNKMLADLPLLDISKRLRIDIRHTQNKKPIINKQTQVLTLSIKLL